MTMPRGFIAVLSALLVGCAGVATQRAHDLSTAGTAYSKASENLIDAAMDASVDKDSFAKVTTKTRSGAPPPPRDTLVRDLSQSDDGLVVTLTLYQQVRASLVALEAYFAALQELADNPQGEATGQAVKSLADHINDLDGVLSKDKKLALSPEQVTAISGLSKLVSDQIHGAIVANALRRDAATVGRMLALSRKAVRIAEQDITAYLALKQDAFYRDRVQKPYIAQTMDDQWIDDRRTYLKAAALGKASEEIVKAEAASAQMQATWEKILSGDLSAAELHKMLTEINQLFAAINTLKSAERPKAPAATQ